MDDIADAIWHRNVGGNINNVCFGFAISYHLYQQVHCSN